MLSSLKERFEIKTLVDRIAQQKIVSPAILNVLGPSVDVFTQNPFSVQIACMALSKGRRFTHHELRGYIPVPEEMEPETSVWEYEQNTPLWIGGIRRNPKHFCFRLDAIFPTFHPNYRSKWPAHELLHSLCGYFWHPEQTRFECYVGARLAELLPLTHWYGLDEVARNRCERHTQKPPTKEYCRTCESMFGPYWETDWNTEQRLHSQKALEFAFAYYQSEREACIKEIETHKRVEIPRILLDSSSDALGYMEGHWNRLCSWSFGAFDELFVRQEEKHSNLTDFVSHIDSVFETLLSEDIQVPSIEKHHEEYAVRCVQDMGKRILTALEWGTEEDKDACWPLLEHAAAAIRNGISIEFDQWMKEVQSCVNATKLPSVVLEPIFQSGLMSKGWSPSLYDGVEQSFDTSIDDSLIEAFVQSKSFWSLGHLWKRLPQFFENEEFALEGWLKQAPHEDREARLFSMPFSQEEGVLRLNTTFREGRFSTEAMNAVLGWEEDAEIIAWWHQGEPFVLVVDEQLQRCMTCVKEKNWMGVFEDSYLYELVSVGLLVWIPIPKT